MTVTTFLTTYQDQPHETLFERLEEFMSAQKDKVSLPLLQEVVINLSSQDFQTVLTSLSFLRDTLLVPIKTKHAQTALDLRELVIQTDLFLALEKCLYSESQAIRLDAIYTSGKLFFSEMIPVLKRAIPFFEEKKQIELDHLLQEYFWLVGSNKYVEVEELLALKSPKVSAAVKRYFTEVFSIESLEDPDKTKLLGLLNSV